jgi:hypothetical protein
MCTWAAFAGPVRPLNDNSQLIVAPLPERVTVAVNVPLAPDTEPDGVGTSCDALSAAATRISLACGRAVPEPASASTAAAATMPTASLFTDPPLLDVGGPTRDPTRSV